MASGRVPPQIYVPNIVVAHPRIPSLVIPALERSSRLKAKPCASSIQRTRALSKTSSFYFRPHESSSRVGMEGFTVWLTIDGSENRYAAKLRSEYDSLRSVSWLGIMPRDRILLLYAKADCLLFPSKLETWGMPISEFQQTGKPMLVIDLPYAHETVGEYHALGFFRQTTLRCWRMRWKVSSRDVSHLARPPLHPSQRPSPRIGLRCSRFFSTRHGRPSDSGRDSSLTATSVGNCSSRASIDRRQHIMVFPGEGNSLHSVCTSSATALVFDIPRKSRRFGFPFFPFCWSPAALNKWLFIWGFCLYLAFCFGCFFDFEQPRINHDNFIRFGADSPTYWDAVEYRSQHVQTGKGLISFTGNLLGPVMLGMFCGLDLRLRVLMFCFSSSQSRWPARFLGWTGTVFSFF